MSFGFGTAFTRPTSGLIPALQLQFAGAEVLDPRITFTRASSGTRFNSAGLMETMTDNTPRFDYDPATSAGVTGPELVADPSFDNPSDWILTATTGSSVIAGGKLTLTVGDGSSTNAAPIGFTPVVGRRYQYTVTASAVSGFGFYVFLGSAAGSGPNITAPGTYSAVVTCTSAQCLISRIGGGAASATIDNISIREATMSPRGLLIEEQRTNLLRHSRDMRDAAWSNTDVTAARTQVGIDGVANTACLMTEGSAGVAELSQTGAAVAAGATVTSSVILRRGNNDWVRILAVEVNLSNGAQGWFNLATGAKGSVGLRGIGSAATSTIQNLGGGWYRCTVSCVPDGVYTLPKLYVVSAPADNAFTRVPNATYIIDAAQLEVGAFPTSFIPTTTAAAIRIADSTVMTGADFSSWYNQTEGTMVAAFTRFGFDGTAGSVALVQADDTTSNNRVALRITPRSSTAGQQGTIVVAGAVLSNDSQIGSDITGSVQTYALAYQVGVGATARNGQTAIAITSVASLPTVTQFQVGQGPGAAPLNGHIRTIKYFNTRLPNATLQGLTA